MVPRRHSAAGGGRTGAAAQTTRTGAGNLEASGAARTDLPHRADRLATTPKRGQVGRGRNRSSSLDRSIRQRPRRSPKICNCQRLAPSNARYAPSFYRDEHCRRLSRPLSSPSGDPGFADADTAANGSPAPSTPVDEPDTAPTAPDAAREQARGQRSRPPRPRPTGNGNGRKPRRPERWRWNAQATRMAHAANSRPGSG